MMTQTSHVLTFKGKAQKFKRRWEGKPTGGKKVEGACLRCRKK
jgi:hypothetical protein